MSKHLVGLKEFSQGVLTNKEGKQVAIVAVGHQNCSDYPPERIHIGQPGNKDVSRGGLSLHREHCT